MKMILTIAWRNIWRNPARSGILITALVAGTWAGIVTAGWTKGLVGQRVEYLIGTELSHMQIHHPEFRMEREVWMAIPDAEEIQNRLDGHPKVRSLSPRTLVFGLAMSPVTTSGVQIRGVDPQKEQATTTFHERIVDGTWFGDEVRNPVIIGRRLSERLGLGIGNRLVLQFQDMDNQITAGAFNITGIFQSASADYDERNVIVRDRDLYTLISGQPVWHEIAVSLLDLDEAENLAAEINHQFPQVHAQTWFQLSPEIRYMTDWSGIVTLLLMAIIMMALSFGILNTMLMAIFERRRELGMLLSIGMGRNRVFNMIMLESLILTIGGASAGMALASLTLQYLSKRGIDMSRFADGLAEFGFDPIVYPFVTAGELASVAVIVIVAALLAALWPAIKVVLMNPVEAAKDA